MKTFKVKNGLLVRDKSPYGAWGSGLFKKTRDVAFQFRMGAGFAGTVNTSHPANIRGFLKDSTNPPTFFGQAVKINPATNAVRAIIAGDSAATDIDGVIVRPFPFLPVFPPNTPYGGQTTFGTSTLPDGAVDVLLSGFIMVPVVGAPSNGSAADVWFAATAAPHVQSGFEATHTGGSSFTITWNKTHFASPADSNGVAELAFNI
jgi:hypothetical protein